MPNKHYVKGASLERKIVNRFRAMPECSFAVRTAGSHSCFDVIAIIGNELLLIQCKAKDMTEGERKKIISSLPAIPWKLNVKLQLRYIRNHKEICESEAVV